MTLKELSSDAEQRSLALAREIGLLDDLTDLNTARREGKAEGKSEASQSFALKLPQKGFELLEGAELTRPGCLLQRLKNSKPRIIH